MKSLVVTFAATAALLSTALPAAAAPPVGEGGHVHHVTTGDGRCVPIDAVAFTAESRGLHQGATASGSGKGPEHGPCQ
jgi:hypothetical protein